MSGTQRLIMLLRQRPQTLKELMEGLGATRRQVGHAIRTARLTGHAVRYTQSRYVLVEESIAIRESTNTNIFNNSDRGPESAPSPPLHDSVRSTTMPPI
jgi:biotin operon repressor